MYNYSFEKLGLDYAYVAFDTKRGQSERWDRADENI